MTRVKDFVCDLSSAAGKTAEEIKETVDTAIGECSLSLVQIYRNVAEAKVGQDTTEKRVDGSAMRLRTDVIILVVEAFVKEDSHMTSRESADKVDLTTGTVNRTFHDELGPVKSAGLQEWSCCSLITI